MKRSRDYTDITADQVDAAISQYVLGRNAARNRAILHTVFIDGVTYEKTAEMFDLSYSQIAAIIHKWEYVVFSHIK